jgi:repressor LexA
MELTERQREVLDAIESLTEQKGHPPSLEEIADAVGIQGASGVSYHVDALEKKGKIEREFDRARTIRIVN